MDKSQELQTRVTSHNMHASECYFYICLQVYQYKSPFITPSIGSPIVYISSSSSCIICSYMHYILVPIYVGGQGTWYKVQVHEDRQNFRHHLLSCMRKDLRRILRQVVETLFWQHEKRSFNTKNTFHSNKKKSTQ